MLLSRRVDSSAGRDPGMLNVLALFARHLKGKGKKVTLLFILGVGGAACSLATPIIGKTFIDSVVGQGNFSLLPRLSLLLFLLALADMALGVATRLAHARLSAAILVEIRERLFDRCLFAPLADLERFRHGDLLNRFGSDVPKVQTVLVDGVLGFFQNILFLCVAATILLRLSVLLTLWSFLGLIAALVVTVSFKKPVEKGTRRVREAMVDLGHFLSERLGALRAVRLHGAQETDRERFSAHNVSLVHSVLRFQLWDAAASGFPGLTLTASLAWLYLLGGRLIESHAISAGTFVAFILYQGKLVAPATGLLGLVRTLQEAKVSLERVAELVAGETTLLEHKKKSAAEGGIDCRGVSFAYSEGSPILDGLCLQVVKGERAALFGPSGAGKSTLVQILFGLRAPQGGEVRIGAGEARGGAPVRLRYAGCDPFLLHATVAENLRYGNPACSVADLCLAVELAEARRFIEELPHGLETVIGGRGMALSDGQRQRIGLARLILGNPEVLVLDEAFSTLDPETEAKVRQNLFRHFAGGTFLVVSHRLDALDDFDTLYLMGDGKVQSVSPEELRVKLLSGTTEALNEMRTGTVLRSSFSLGGREPEKGVFAVLPIHSPTSAFREGRNTLRKIGASKVIL